MSPFTPFTPFTHPPPTHTHTSTHVKESLELPKVFDGAGCLIVVEQRDGVVQVRQVVALQLQCLVVPGGSRETEMGDREKCTRTVCQISVLAPV